MGPEESPFGTVAEILETARLHHMGGRIGDAEDLYWQAMSADPAHPTPYHQLGIIALQAGKFTVAAEMLDTALALNDQEPLYHANRGAAYYMVGELKAAEESFRSAVELAPGYYEAWFNLGLVQRHLRNWEGAAETFEKAVEADTAEVVTDKQAAPFVYLAEARAEVGDREGAKPMARAAVNLSGQDPEIGEVLLKVLVELEMPEEAIQLGRELVQADPGSSHAHRNLASALFLAGQEEQAEQVMLQAYRLAPNDPSVFAAMARLRMAIGDQDGARQWVAQARSRDPESKEYEHLAREIG